MTTLDKLRQLRREHMLYCYAATPLPPNRECSCGASAHNALLDECIASEQARIEAERWRKSDIRPPENEEVFINISSPFGQAMYIGVFDHGVWLKWEAKWKRLDADETVTHWRPLLTPPTKEAE